MFMEDNKILKVISQGDENCEHIWCCNPISEMTIEDNCIVFKYDRICEECLRQELIKSNKRGKNIKNYKNIKEK